MFSALGLRFACRCALQRWHGHVGQLCVTPRVLHLLAVSLNASACLTITFLCNNHGGTTRIVGVCCTGRLSGGVLQGEPTSVTLDSPVSGVTPSRPRPVSACHTRTSMMRQKSSWFRYLALHRTEEGGLLRSRCLSHTVRGPYVLRALSRDTDSL